MGKKPTKADLLGAIGSLQSLIGAAMGQNTDRNPNRYARVSDLLDRAFDLCVEARSEFPPNAGSRSRFAKISTKTDAV